MHFAQYTQAFLDDARTQLRLMREALQILVEDCGNAQALADLRRAFHTLKSTAATMELASLAMLCREQEAMLIPLLEAKQCLSIEACEVVRKKIERVEEEIVKMTTEESQK